jgi:hypothetical protein
LKKVRPSALGKKRRRKPAHRSREAINSRRLLDEPPDRAEPPACRFHLAAKMRRENHVADSQRSVASHENSAVPFRQLVHRTI